MKMQVPAQVKELAESTVEQAEKAFTTFIEAAHKSVDMVPHPATDISKKTLSLTEQNMKTAFDHARNLLHATDLQHFMQIQSDYLKTQFTTAQEQMKQLGGDMMASAKTAASNEKTGYYRRKRDEGKPMPGLT
ncbi:phasin [Tardiphaga sp. vice352]|uniref:phasin n=1 Tax=Tardiphaga sp. vice352 TaxID=2592816 RepID=UPI00116395A8|nr:MULTISPECIES: phasin [unclassified Tardiphaga]QDM19251.1 phasin [Tardiphaga sp. vice278]QDM34552.1 phasin [Tardiphaga sp. vice352]